MISDGNAFTRSVAHECRRRSHCKPELVREIGRLRIAEAAPPERSEELDRAEAKVAAALDRARSP